LRGDKPKDLLSAGLFLLYSIIDQKLSNPSIPYMNAGGRKRSGFLLMVSGRQGSYTLGNRGRCESEIASIPTNIPQGGFDYS
jgi:hypothetical protein